MSNSSVTLIVDGIVQGTLFADDFIKAIKKEGLDKDTIEIIDSVRKYVERGIQYIGYNIDISGSGDYKNTQWLTLKREPSIGENLKDEMQKYLSTLN